MTPFMGDAVSLKGLTVIVLGGLGNGLLVADLAGHG